MTEVSCSRGAGSNCINYKINLTFLFLCQNVTGHFTSCMTLPVVWVPSNSLQDRISLLLFPILLFPKWDLNDLGQSPKRQGPLQLAKPYTRSSQTARRRKVGAVSCLSPACLPPSLPSSRPKQQQESSALVPLFSFPQQELEKAKRINCTEERREKEFHQ